MQERHRNRVMYFNELARTCEKYFIPYIEKQRHINNGYRILEIGCGDGGNLLPFAKRGCKTVGVDIAECRVKDAHKFFKDNGVDGVFIASDIFKVDSPHEGYDIIIVHDVIEHICNKVQLISMLPKFLNPNGIVFISFPAWQMPFGGHQQICKSHTMSHLPFIHLLPKNIYFTLLKITGEDESCINELMSIKNTRTTIELFERIVNNTKNIAIRDRKLWLINPHYETKFGLRPRLLPSWIARIPYLRNFFTSSCFYILMVNKD